MSKQTAVEFYRTELNALVSMRESKFKTEQEIYDQAKAMEREQIEDAFQDGKWDWHDHIKNGIESKDLAQYYKETYKGGEQ